jgi:hypothetical protein
MSEQSIDRKLSRCAREIEAAKPKGLSFDDFRFLNHDIKGAAKREQTKQEPSPPAAQADVGVRVWAAQYGDFLYKRYEDGLLLSRDKGVTWVQSANTPSWLDRGIAKGELLELIPSEPKAEGGWIEWKGGECPVEPETLVVVQNKFGHITVTKPRKAAILALDGPGQLTAYRVVKP